MPNSFKQKSARARSDSFRRKIMGGAKYKNSAITLTLFLSLLCFSGCGEAAEDGSVSPTETQAEATAVIEEVAAPVLQSEIGYLSSAAYQSGYIVVGSQGRIDKINISGEIAAIDSPVNCVLLDVAVEESTGTAMVVGENGVVLFLDENGDVSELDTGNTGHLTSVCNLNGVWIVGGYDGVLLRIYDPGSWEGVSISLNGRITGLASSDERCIGVTDGGEIFVSTDGTSWDVLDFGEYYGESLYFSSINCLGTTFWTAALDADGKSRIHSSVEGGVWSERNMIIYSQNDMTDISTSVIGDLCGDGDQMFAALTDGRVLTMPSCAECNELQEISDSPLYTGAYNGGKVLFAGEDYFHTLQDLTDVRQDQIKPEAALEKQREGALIIDVRSPEEFLEKHIAGALNLEVSTVEAELSAICPDPQQEIIFYCAAGVRSQAALEVSQNLGYVNVYNLGKLDNWPYDTQTGQD